MGGTKHERELVNHLRRVFRDNIHAERAFYWAARFLASANPWTSAAEVVASRGRTRGRIGLVDAEMGPLF